MKNLIFLTSHRQLDEIYLYGEFLKKSNCLKEFDFLLHVNNPSLDITDSYDNIPNKNKNFIITSKNCGYSTGLHEAISDNFEIIKNYDNVIHSHPDIFPINEQKILDIIHQNQDYSFIVNYSVAHEKEWMSTDLFIFKPKLFKENPFKDYMNNLNNMAERSLYNIGKNFSHIYVKRFDNDHYDPRRVCMWGCLHEHNLNIVRGYL